MIDPNSKQVERMFQAILTLTPSERSAYLDQHCPDESVRCEVEKLLCYDQLQGGGLTEDFKQSARPAQVEGKDGLSPDTAAQSPTSTIDHGQFLPGTVLSKRYRIIGMLGKGGMGEVYRADDLQLGQSVALKFLPRRLAQDVRALERFRAEVRLARQVSHPNVCRVYDIGQIDDQWFLSMEYVDGEDLAQLLRRIGRFPSDRATELARQLCLGLHAAHEKGVLHRDLKPANVMIDGRGKLLITDFGLAELNDQVRSEDIRSGTPAYMSPEQLAGREVTERSDIYSLGIILHEIYTGKPVWNADSMSKLVAQRNDSSTPQPSSHVRDLDPAIENVIQRCMDPAPERRPPSAISVMAALPGGDPLQAALAAGQTPSPQMVADSGDEGSLSWIVGGSLFGIICLLALATPFLFDRRNRYDFGQLANNKPDVLERAAKEYVASLGYESNPADHASGFQLDRHNNFEFWYRQCDKLLEIELPNAWANPTDWRISTHNPSIVKPGMLTLRLDTEGKLLEFLAVPRFMAEAGIGVIDATDSTTDWAQFFSLLGLDHAEFEPEKLGASAISERPPTYSTQTKAWQSIDQDPPTHVVMAVQQGKLTYFRRYNEDSVSGLMTAFMSSARHYSYSGAVTVVFFCIALLFAIQNLRTIRVDVVAATYFAAFFFAGNILLWILQSRGIYKIIEDREVAANYFFTSTAMSARLLIYYLAFEPIIRRFWPNMLVTWARLSSGRLRDPLLGRDLLTGCLIGQAWLLLHVTIFDPSYSSSVFPNSADTVVPRHAIAALLGSVQFAVLGGIGALSWLTCFRVLFQNTWIAAIGCVLVVSFSLGVFEWTNWGFALIVTGIYLRGGLLLGLIFVVINSFLSQVPVTADLQSWYSSSGLLMLAVIFIVAGYGFYCSTVRPALKWGM